MKKNPTEKGLKELFKGMYTFGDSLTDYGSLAAYVYKTVLDPTVLPPWSGVTFSNGNPVSQLDLRIRLGLTPPSIPAPNEQLPSPYYLLANPYVAPPGLGTPGGPSFSIGGATSGSASVYNVLEVPDPATNTNVPLATLIPQLSNTGVQNQIRAALAQGVRPTSRELTLVEGGGNDLLVAQIEENPDLAGVFQQALLNMRENLRVLLRAMGARQLLTFGMADFRGTVNGVPYQMPFLSEILAAASAPDAPAWLQQWKQFDDAGGLERFQRDYAAMVADVARQFPYAAVIYHSPEFGDNWKLYGEQLGDFADFGIQDTLSYAQAKDQPLTDQETNSFLYFDTVHNASNGQVMAGKAMALTLKSAASAIEGATLGAREIGNNRPNLLVAKSGNTELIGLGAGDVLLGDRGNDALSGDQGNDRLEGERGTDWLSGGRGSDTLTGGRDADFFAYELRDVRASWRDVITDFNSAEGDRLGLTAILDGSDPFANPGWTFLGAQPFTGSGAELRFLGGVLQGDVDGDGRADLRIRLEGINAFDAGWIT